MPQMRLRGATNQGIKNKTNEEVTNDTPALELMQVFLRYFRVVYLRGY